MQKLSILFLSTMLLFSCSQSKTTSHFIGKKQMKIENKRLSPEVLWAMGRINGYTLSPDSKLATYSVSYYDVEQNKSHSVIYVQKVALQESTQLTTSNANESSATFSKDGKKIYFLSTESGSNQLWSMNIDGSNRKKISEEKEDLEGYKFSPDFTHILFIKEVPTTTSIAAQEKDLPKASGMVINEVMYKHWDHYVKTIPHPFIAKFNSKNISEITDILKDEPYESPMLPFGGMEQLTWSPDSKTIAYTSRKKVGMDYATSTDSDIFLYNIETGKTTNACKPADYKATKVDMNISFENQAVNKGKADNHVGYDQNPQFSPDGNYLAWTSMKRDGYESDRTRLCVLNLKTEKYSYLTESFRSGVNNFLWAPDSKTLYFTGVWHGVSEVYSTNFKGEVKKLTNEVADYSLVEIADSGNSLITMRHSMSKADEVYRINLKDNSVKQLTEENKEFYDQLDLGEVKERWIKTIDGKKEQCWIIYPPHFDPSKKYPTLLYCEGGPQSPISQFWSYRWNFQIMAANNYIIVAPNRRGLPGYGMKWLEEISGDYTGLCMQDYLSAIDEMAKEPYVDNDHLGCIGASFGGFSVYWLAGHHNKRFKCFIAHDGIFNTEQQYYETDELWFPNWDFKGAPFRKDAKGKTFKGFEDSPHLSVNKWDTPILCIHGKKDYRILNSQGESAFQAARMRGIPAQLLLLPDENHWVLQPQNGILWQRTFFRWLDRWLKPEN